MIFIKIRQGRIFRVLMTIAVVAFSLDVVCIDV